jgi:hypothetical protein
MDGVILFVDDNLDEYTIKENGVERTLENELFEELRKEYPVLGVRNLDLAEEAIKSIGSFSAIILDWVFDKKDLLLKSGEDAAVLGGIKLSREGLDTLEFLKHNEFYSLVYIFSNENVKDLYGAELQKKYRKRIKFRKKGESKNQAKRIAQDIIKWRDQNENLAIPNVWTKTINQSVQKILLELSDADRNWIRELANTAKEDGVSGEIFIIEILQNLLAESLIQDPALIASIKEHVGLNEGGQQAIVAVDEKSVAKLFRRIFYTKLDKDAPVMTGDVCKLSRKKFGIIITPECDIHDVVQDPSKTFELLTFARDSFEWFMALQMNYQYARNKYEEWMGTNNGKEKLKKLRARFNNGESTYHILPSFPFSDTALNQSAAIDLSEGRERFSYLAIKDKRTYKLNSPFIQQLRQRYISHLGRVGTPSLPTSVRNLNLR